MLEQQRVFRQAGEKANGQARFRCREQIRRWEERASKYTQGKGAAARKWKRTK